MRHSPMPKWIVSFGLTGVGLALIYLFLFPAADPDNPTVFDWIAWGALYPGLAPIASWYPVTVWVACPLAARVLGLALNFLFFGAIGAWLYRQKEASLLVRFAVPAVSWPVLFWFCVYGWLYVETSWRGLLLWLEFA